ncbi:tRNA lysidine(34) synthetase TilS [Longibacter salinarum]|uniref:tRNA(Ile)-lysidine synthase n=1 Tax=Longibacter salinarum TaxID=1850348 RepID=A0A2A8CW72_9BACT|nr:tRNA lysidine(34) synthetase TilS [Longibacter salinarum]PEN12942.1 tRNA lysidine(34) synthetase TilS [Longibacter salinarum]
MTDLRNTVRKVAAEHNLWPGDSSVVVGVSGGVDSMVLLDVLNDVLVPSRRLVVVHVNYGLRDGASRDEELVRNRCQTFGSSVDFIAFHPDMSSAAHEGSLQRVARDVRYDLFRRVANERDAATVVVAHHRQDQAETVLLRLFRGAGPEALAGMKWLRPLRDDATVQLARPLLDTSPAEIRAYATEHSVPWREDPTNMEGPYARAKLRTTILPSIEEAFPGATDRIAHAGTLLRQISDATLEPERQRWVEAITEERGGTIVLCESALHSAPEVWADRVILDVLRSTIPGAPRTAAVAREVRSLLDSQVGSRVELGQGTVWRDRGGLRIVASRAERVSPMSLSPGSPVTTPFGRITMSVEERLPETDIDDLIGESAREAVMDADALGENVVVRSWEDGDRIQPLGMKGSKGVADVMTDARVPPHERARTLVVTVPEHIVWVVGHRIHHAFRVRDRTTRCARLRFVPGNRRE